MRATVEGAGVELAYQESGRGQSVLLVHDMAHDARSWRQASQRIGPAARVVVYDRRGYGHSGAPEPYEGTTVYEQSEDAAALVAHLGLAPALVCGTGFGALIALDLAARHPDAVRSLVCVEPPLYAFVPQATEVLAAERELLREIVEEHGPRAAMQAWRTQHTATDAARQGTPPAQHSAAPPAACAGDDCEPAPSQHRPFFADFAGLSSWPVTRAELRAIAVPVVVLTGPATAAHLLAAADVLTRLLPAARRARDGDAGAAVVSLLG